MSAPVAPRPPVPPVPLPPAGPPPAPPRPRPAPRGRVAAALSIPAAALGVMVISSIISVASVDDKPLRVFGYVNLVVAGLTVLAAGIAAAVVAAVSSSARDPRTPLRALAIGGGLAFVPPALLVLLFGVAAVAVSWQGALLSLPTTALALWAFRRMQRNRKPPWRLLVLAFAWGMTVSSYFAGSVEGMLHALIGQEVLPGTAAIMAHAAAAAFPEELIKAAGVAVIVLVARRRVVGLLGGLVIGSCVGVGFQFAESLSYMPGAIDVVLYQHWSRQVTGLLVSHATYTGIVGAGFGMATMVAGRWQKVLCAASGLALAIAAHLVWDFCAMGHYYWESADANLQLFVVQPANLLLFKGPGFVALLVLVVLGLRLEARELLRHLRAEAATGLNAVTADEVPVLMNPPRRFRLRMHALWRESRREYRRLKRLHATQLELAFTRWHRERGAEDRPWTEEFLRQAIYRLKRERTREADRQPAGQKNQ